MMILPEFTKQDPSITWLRNEQDRLRTQADKMLAVTGILAVYDRHGIVSPIGESYRYKLMIYPDLDIDLQSNAVTKQNFANLTRDLAVHPFVRGIATADTVNFSVSKHPHPKGYWIGVDIPFEDDRWGIDCWL